MKKIKRIVACLCVCVLLTTAPTTAYAKANSFKPAAVVEIITSAICSTPQGALVAVLALVGITGTAYIYDNRENIEKFAMDMYDRAERWFEKMADKVSVTWNDFQDWLGGVANGALDTSSECWDVFKDFCTDLANEVSNPSIDVPSSPQSPSYNVGAWVVGNNPGWSADIDDFHYYTINDLGYSSTIKKFKEEVGLDLSNWPYDYYPDVYGWSTTNLISSEKWFNLSLYGSYRYGAGTYDLGGAKFGLVLDKADIKRAAWYINSEKGNMQLYYLKDGAQVITNYGYSSDMSWFEGYEDDVRGTVTKISNIPFFTSLEVLQEYFDTGTLDSAEDWACVYGETLPVGYTFTSTFDMVIGTGLPLDEPVDIPKPDETADDVFGDVSDVVVAPDTDRVIDRDGNLDNVGVADVTGVIIDGVISIPIDGVDGVSISNPYEVIDGVYPVDTIDGTILGTDTPIEGVTPVNPSGGHEYTIPNLQELFPFCIPFDLVNLYSCLKAEPKAPSVKFPLPVPQKGGGFTYKYIEIDLSDFDSVAKVLRTMELLVFCVGLTLVTRNLIRG